MSRRPTLRSAGRSPTLPPIKKTPAPAVDRAVTVGGFSASTPLPVGGPTAPATVCKSVQCQAFFIAACRDGSSIHPLRPQVKTGSGAWAGSHGTPHCVGGLRLQCV